MNTRQEVVENRVRRFAAPVVYDAFYCITFAMLVFAIADFAIAWPCPLSYYRRCAVSIRRENYRLSDGAYTANNSPQLKVDTFRRNGTCSTKDRVSIPSFLSSTMNLASG